MLKDDAIDQIIQSATGELEILAAYRAFFSGALQEQQTSQARILKQAEERFGQVAQQRMEQLLNTHVVERDWWKDAGGFSFELPTCPDTETIRATMEAVRSALTNAIQRKQAQPAQRVKLSEPERAASAIWTEVAATVSNYMAAIAPINVAIAERQRTAGTVDFVPIEQRIAALNAHSTQRKSATNLL